MSNLQAIFSSKLYLASTRKDKIKVALTNPVNKELVLQLEEYLDEEYRTPSKSSSDSVSTNNIDTDATDNDWDISDDSDSDSGFASRPSAPPKFAPISEKRSEELEDLDGGLDGEPDVEPTEEEPTDANSAVKLGKNKITASEYTDIQSNYGNTQIRNIASEIKGILNTSSVTSGVLRTMVKNDEIWIYYNDDTNLNNALSPVIDMLNAANYSYLTFNRLARTDNAIVFTINYTESK